MSSRELRPHPRYAGPARARHAAIGGDADSNYTKSYLFRRSSTYGANVAACPSTTAVNAGESCTANTALRHHTQKESRVRLTAEVLAAQDYAALPSTTERDLRYLRSERDGVVEGCSGRGSGMDMAEPPRDRGDVDLYRFAASLSQRPLGEQLQLDDLDLHNVRSPETFVRSKPELDWRGRGFGGEVAQNSHWQMPTDGYYDLQRQNCSRGSGFRSTEINAEEETTIVSGPVLYAQSQSRAARTAATAAAAAAVLPLPCEQPRAGDLSAAVERQTARQERAALVMRDLEARMEDSALFARPYTASPDATRPPGAALAPSGWSVRYMS